MLTEVHLINWAFDSNNSTVLWTDQWT